LQSLKLLRWTYIYQRQQDIPLKLPGAEYNVMKHSTPVYLTKGHPGSTMSQSTVNSGMSSLLTNKIFT